MSSEDVLTFVILASLILLLVGVLVFLTAWLLYGVYCDIQSGEVTFWTFLKSVLGIYLLVSLFSIAKSRSESHD